MVVFFYSLLPTNSLPTYLGQLPTSPLLCPIIIYLSSQNICFPSIFLSSSKVKAFISSKLFDDFFVIGLLVLQTDRLFYTALWFSLQVLVVDFYMSLWLENESFAEVLISWSYFYTLSSLWASSLKVYQIEVVSQLTRDLVVDPTTRFNQLTSPFRKMIFLSTYFIFTSIYSLIPPRISNTSPSINYFNFIVENP